VVPRWDGCTIEKNPLSNDGKLLERMDSRQWINGSSKIIVLGQRVGCIIEGWEVSRDGCF